MKKRTVCLMVAALAAGTLCGCSGSEKPEETTVASGAQSEAAKEDEGKKPEASEEKTVYPAGTITIYGTGQPQYLKEYFDAWLERNRDIAPEVTLEIVQNESQAKSREKITMTALAGAEDDLPDAVYIDPVNILDLAQAGLLRDETEFVSQYIDEMVEGATNDATISGKIYGLPESVRPNVLFYNQEIFDKYHFSIFLVFELKFTPILNILRLSDWNGRA